MSSTQTVDSAPLLSSQGVLRYGWRVVALLFVAGMLSYLDRSMLATMRVSLTQAIPMSSAEFGLLSSVFLWVYGISSPFVGYLADRYSRTRIIVFSIFTWSLTLVVTAFVSSYAQLLILRALLGVSEACYVPAAMALLADYHRGSTRSTATGIHVASFFIGQTLAFLGGYLAEHYGWNIPFLVFGLTGVSFSFLLPFVLRDAPDHKDRNREVEKAHSSLSSVAGNILRPVFIYHCVQWSCLFVIAWIIMGWLPTYFQDRFGLPQTAAAIYATVFINPAAIIGTLAGGYLTSRWLCTRTDAHILLPLLLLAVAFPLLLMASIGTTVVVTVGLLMGYALTRSVTDANIMPILCSIVDVRYRATAFGILNFFACTSGGIALYVVGMLRDHQVPLQYIYMGAALGLIPCILFLLLIRRAFNTTIHLQ